MKQKNWIRKYGIHIAVCVAVLAAAFGINRKINIDRSHIYTVSSGTTVLEKLTEFKVKKGNYIFGGWGFDPKNYSENTKCELILQDTETKEALWPAMSKNPGGQEIEERYADGGDYSAGSFAGKISESKVDKDKVYEILLRYTSETKNEAGEVLPYIVTVTTNDFLYQGAVTEYNPKTFAAPEIAGTLLEKELEGARLFHYFEEGMWVYVKDGKMYYVLDKVFPIDKYVDSCIAVNWYATKRERVLAKYAEYEIGISDFLFSDAHIEELDTNKYEVAVIKVPSEYVSIIRTGLYDHEEKWVLDIYKQFKE